MGGPCGEGRGAREEGGTPGRGGHLGRMASAIGAPCSPSFLKYDSDHSNTSAPSQLRKSYPVRGSSSGGAPPPPGALPPIATLLFLASLSIRRSVHVLLLLPRLPPQPSDLACYYLGSRVPLCGEICLVFACSVFLSLSLQ